MELQKDAWSLELLDSEDQQMASHENPGEVAQWSPQLTTLLSHQVRQPDFVTLECLKSCPLTSKCPTLPCYNENLVFRFLQVLSIGTPRTLEPCFVSCLQLAVVEIFCVPYPALVPRVLCLPCSSSSQSGPPNPGLEVIMYEKRTGKRNLRLHGKIW